jgi:hypothetical protein
MLPCVFGALEALDALGFGFFDVGRVSHRFSVFSSQKNLP